LQRIHRSFGLLSCLHLHQRGEISSISAILHSLIVFALLLIRERERISSLVLALCAQQPNLQIFAGLFASLRIGLANLLLLLPLECLRFCALAVSLPLILGAWQSVIDLFQQTDQSLPRSVDLLCQIVATDIRTKRIERQP
jgi:hypothetical protein